jgi:hypothetical protein
MIGADRRRAFVAVWLALLLAAAWGWWAAKSGAYFGRVFYPGTVALAALALVIFVAVPPLRLRPRREAAIALGFLVALAAWTLLSILWTPTPDTALDDSTQVFAYALAFALGLWLRRLSANPLTGLLPVAVAGAIAGLVAVVALSAGHHLTAYLHPDASFRYPLGYRNANGAFFLIALWPALTLASSMSINRWLRAAMLGVSTLCIELAILSQSRGSTIAVAISALVVFALSPARLRLAAYLGLAALPVLATLPALLDVYQHGAIAGALPFLRDAAVAVAFSVIVAMAIGAVSTRVERGIGLSPEVARRAERRLAIAAAVLAVTGFGAFVAAKGGPVHFVDQRLHEFTRGGYPDLSGQGARFGANIGSNRNDFWRVALHEGARLPLLGGGAGSFQLDYLRERRSHETPTDPHSVEMLMLTELGIPGLLLFAGFVVMAAAGVARSRPQHPALAAAALAAGAYWLVHSSYDWFWNYPAMTAPAICLLGAACAPRPAGSDGPEKKNP